MLRRQEQSPRRSSEPDQRARLPTARTARIDSDGRVDPPVLLEEPLTTWLSLSWGIELG